MISTQHKFSIGLCGVWYYDDDSDDLIRKIEMVVINSIHGFNFVWLHMRETNCKAEYAHSHMVMSKQSSRELLGSQTFCFLGFQWNMKQNPMCRLVCVVFDSKVPNQMLQLLWQQNTHERNIWILLMAIYFIGNVFWW